MMKSFLHTRNSILLMVVFYLLIGHEAFAGEAPMPRHAEELISCSCVQRSGKGQIETFRSKLAYGSKSVSELKITDQGTESIPVSEIATILLNHNRANSAGFVNATLQMRGEDERRSVMIKVTSKGSKLMLHGYTRDGDPVKVEILSCKSIKFSYE